MLRGHVPSESGMFVNQIDRDLVVAIIPIPM